MRKMEPAGSGATWTGSRMASEGFERVKRSGGAAVTQRDSARPGFPTMRRVELEGVGT
jgi:hypothetical protein